LYVGRPGKDVAFISREWKLLGRFEKNNLMLLTYHMPNTGLGVHVTLLV
jgi:hypothetical protein